MVRVLVLVNELVSTSIPVEIAAKTHAQTDAEITIVSYYDESGDKIDPDISELDLPIIRLGASSRVDPAAYRLLRFICLIKPIDILHTHHNSTGSLARLAVVGTDTEVVNTEHNDHKFFSHLQKTINSLTYPLVDVFVSNSENTKKSLEWYEKILAAGTLQKVIYNGVDNERIDRADHLDIDLPNRPLIVIVGRLIEQKNHATLLRAFESVLACVPKSTLVIVGDGPLADDLKTLTVDLGIADSVLFTGYLPRRKTVYSILKQSTVAVFPSWYEGFCVAAVEAMAAGLPIVVSDLDVLHEVVGNPGIFADPGAPSEFADAIIELLSNPDKRKTLGVQSKERARNVFSLDQTARAYYNIYTDLAETSEQ